MLPITSEMTAAVERGGGETVEAVLRLAEEGDEVVIDGSKTFISNGLNADLVVVAARDPAVENPYEALSLYLVESGTPGFTRGRHLEKMGMWSQDTAELFFEDCRVPRENLLGPEEGQGFIQMLSGHQFIERIRLGPEIVGISQPLSGNVEQIEIMLYGGINQPRP